MAQMRGVTEDTAFFRLCQMRPLTLDAPRWSLA